MRKQIRIRRKGFAVLGASIVLAVAPLSTAFANLPTDTNKTENTNSRTMNSEGGCGSVDARQNWGVAKICRELNDTSQPGSTGVTTTQEPSKLNSSSDSYLENPYLWAAVVLAGVAGAFVAIMRRHRPAALS